MSVSLWRWTKVCDTHICIGDCDTCSYETVLPEDTDLIKLPSGVYVNKPMQSFMLTWIPCKDNLPDTSIEVLVSIHDDTGDTPFDYTSYGWFIPDNKIWIVDNEINNHVTAWVDLPKPYKE